MKHFALIIIAILTFTTAQAQIIGSLSTKMQGGVMGKTQELLPQIGFYEAGTNLMEETMIFTNVVVSQEIGTATYMINAKSGGENYYKFIDLLTSENDAILKVGYKINNINNNIGRSVTEWFDADLLGKDIGKIEFVITKINFATPGTNRLGDGNWTDFIYEVTINIYGKDELVVQN
ncbi:MAG: hypothetical protein HC803_11225 [Saprospiraceae bacterium]|nr:hypothetical protein [Saprospiraceae bacterium]